MRTFQWQTQHPGHPGNSELEQLWVLEEYVGASIEYFQGVGLRRRMVMEQVEDYKKEVMKIDGGRWLLLETVTRLATELQEAGTMCTLTLQYFAGS